MDRVRPTSRPTSWWLEKLRQRSERMASERLDLEAPLAFENRAEQEAAVKFFNAAFRAEESGLTQAHQLADEVESWDEDLAEVLRLYGSEEGWHRQLLTQFLQFIGGDVKPMGRVTKSFYRLYGRAKRMESIVLTNLMFETIGATTYRLALGRIPHPAARRMLTILTRDESFHVPLNVHFLRAVLSRANPARRRRLRRLHRLLFFSLVLLPLASRPKAKKFDKIGTLELSRAYAEQLSRLFLQEPDLGLPPPWPVLALFGLTRSELVRAKGLGTASIEAAEQASDRDSVVVTAL